MPFVFISYRLRYDLRVLLYMLDILARGATSKRSTWGPGKRCYGFFLEFLIFTIQLKSKQTCRAFSLLERGIDFGHEAGCFFATASGRAGGQNFFNIVLSRSVLIR